MIKRLSKYRALSWQERRVLLTAILLLPIFWFSLRVLGLARFQKWLNRSCVIDHSRISVQQVTRIANMVGIASNHGLIRASCLTRSLLLGWLLRRQGFESELRIGVRMIDGGLDAHAWLEKNGVPINDAPSIVADFAPFATPIAFELPGQR